MGLTDFITGGESTDEDDLEIELEVEDETDAEEVEMDDGGSRLLRLVALAVVLGVVAYAAYRLRSTDDAEDTFTEIELEPEDEETTVE